MPEAWAEHWQMVEGSGGKQEAYSFLEAAAMVHTIFLFLSSIIER